MAKRFFTADFHFGMGLLLDEKIMGNAVRPFKSVDEMNAAFVQNCNAQAKVVFKDIPVIDKFGKQKFTYECKLNDDGSFALDQETGQLLIEKHPVTQKTIVSRDIIIHIGDLACFGADRSYNGLSVNPQEFIQQINASFINIRGNHDLNNRVKSVCNNMQISLGKRFPYVTLGHYPSYDVHAKDTSKEGWIHLCGHVHSAWKHCLDTTNSVLNINVGVDAWNYKIVSEDELIQYIDDVMKLSKDKLNKVKIVGNKIVKVS